MTSELRFVDFSPNDDIQFDNIPRKSNYAFLSMQNISSRKVTYKIKTTSPRQYIVKPNHGIIPPKQTARIEFQMLPTDGLPSEVGLNDKFMIMITELEENFDLSKLAEIWKDKNQKNFQHAKFRAVFKGVEPPPERKSIGANSIKGTPDRPRNTLGMRASQGGDMFYSGVNQNKFESNGALKKESNDRIIQRLEDAERNLNKVTAERDKFYQELISLKESMTNRPGAKAVIGFQLWQLLLTGILCLIIGAFLSA